MNLTKLFETQKLLRDRINYNEPDRNNKLILALLVELGECANEWRGFKFWSKDQMPRTEEMIECDVCGGSGRGYSGYCGSCHGGYVGKTNPLLEEYVDGLHFVLEIGIEIAHEIQFDVQDYFREIADELRGNSQKTKTIPEQYNYIFYLVTTVNYDFHFPYLFAAYSHLGEMLGFTWDQIEAAYYEKNQINHLRQENGY